VFVSVHICIAIRTLNYVTALTKNIKRLLAARSSPQVRIPRLYSWFKTCHTYQWYQMYV